MKISRRKLASMLTAAAATGAVTAQVPAAPQSSAEAAQELSAAQAQLRAGWQQIARVPLPMHVEPAVRFEA
jgi:hypothetical protein